MYPMIHIRLSLCPLTGATSTVSCWSLKNSNVKHARATSFPAVATAFNKASDNITVAAKMRTDKL